MNFNNETLSDVIDILIVVGFVLVLGDLLNSYLEGAMLSGIAFLGARVLHIILIAPLAYWITRLVHPLICRNANHPHLKEHSK